MQTQMRTVTVQPRRISVRGRTLCKRNKDSSPAGVCQTVLPMARTNARSVWQKGTERGERKAVPTTLYIKAHPSRCCFLRYERVAL